jgi:threonine/homoserine/homoserine lactone efflux protein
VPGPTEIALVTRSITAGVASGLLMIAGIVAADCLFIVGAVAGLAALANALGALFTVVRVVAGAYLILLGIRQLRRAAGAPASPKPGLAAGLGSVSSGFLLTLGDPKAIFGYMSLLPAFVDLTRVSVRETLAVMLLATAAISLAKGCYVVLAERTASLLRSHRARRALDTLAGCTLAATGLFLVIRGSLPAFG